MDAGSLVGHILPGVAYIALSACLLGLALQDTNIKLRRPAGVIILVASVAIVMGWAFGVDGWTNPHRPVEGAFVPFAIALIVDGTLDGILWRAGVFASSIFTYLFFYLHDHTGSGMMGMPTAEEKAHAGEGILFGFAALFALLSIIPFDSAQRLRYVGPEKPLQRPVSDFARATMSAAALFWLMAGVWMIIMGICLYGGSYGPAGANWTHVWTGFNWVMLTGASLFFLVPAVIKWCKCR